MSGSLYFSFWYFRVFRQLLYPNLFRIAFCREPGFSLAVITSPAISSRPPQASGSDRRPHFPLYNDRRQA